MIDDPLRTLGWGFDWHTGQEGKARGFDWDTESVFMAFRDTALTEVNVSAKSPLYFNWLFEHKLNGELASQPGKVSIDMKC